jgi:hypothetical protein
MRTKETVVLKATLLANTPTAGTDTVSEESATGPLFIIYEQFRPIYGFPWSRNGVRWKIEHDGFPRPVKLGTRRIAWLKSEIDAWISTCADARDAA